MGHNEERRIKERLDDLIAKGNYKEADQMLREYLTRGGRYDDVA